jgi:serine/threonine-protein kinase
VSGTSERWQRLEELCQAALERSAGERAAFLLSACGNNADLRREIETLLAHEDASSQFLETPVGGVAAHVMGEPPSFSGARLGPFEVGPLLGAGGMGEVYRACDSNLHRDVALKILPDLFAVDPDRLARFKREAQVLASLNHPNIAAIYGFEEWHAPVRPGGTPVHALVLELVEGPTLADRIARGPLSPADALPIARQIAEALEAAHEHGILHRDLKPANIKLRPDGTVKVLDFGLAKVWQPDDIVGAEPTASSTITSASHIQKGLILGTPAYVSPEQAKGREADRRSDVWAFGAVFYEMLSGQRAFKGDDTTDTLAAVLRQDVDWTALPASTPAAVRRLIARCLDRDVTRRLRDIGEARIVLSRPAGSAGDAFSDESALARVRTVWRRAAPAVLAATLVGTLAAAAAWYVKPSPARSVTRFPFALADGQSITLPANRHMIALSPDGERMVYVANARLYVRSMSELDVHPIQGTERDQPPTDPVFSPDGQSIAFYAPADQTIKRIAVTGGVAVTICHADIPYGITWEEAAILIGQGRKGIMRVSPNGGTPEVLVRVKENEEAHGPQLLPDGQHILFTLASGIDFSRWDNAHVVVQSLASGERKALITGTDARFATSGHLVYALGATLFAVPFDAGRLVVTGAPVPMIDGVLRSANRETGASHFSLSRNGSLIYLPGGLTGPEWGQQEIILTDRKGNVEPLKLPLAQYRGGTRASPDGTRIAFGIDDGHDAIVYTYDLAGGSPMRRLTFGGKNRSPIWSADSRRVTFQSDREGDLALFWQAADGTGTAERLTTPGPGESHEPEAWSLDGETLLFSSTRGTDVSLWTLPLQTRKAEPFGEVHSDYPTGARFSPDGRWIAYARTGQGATRYAIYVQPFPATGATYQLFVKESNDSLTNSPHKVAWSLDGKELFYVPRLGGFEAVTVTTRPTFAFGNAVAVPRPFQPGAPNSRTLYDITPGGKFVGLKTMPQLENGNFTAPTIQVVLNWFEELNGRVPHP